MGEYHPQGCVKTIADRAASWARRALVVLCLLYVCPPNALIPGAMAQEPVPVVPPFVAAPPGAPAPAGPIGEDIEVRFHFVLLDQLAYQIHPFFQITEDPGFTSGKAASAFINTIGTRTTDEDVNFLVRLVHALPPFGIEGVRAIDLPFPRGIGFGFDHFVFPQTDVDAAEGVSTVIPITADTYIYNASLRFYFFNPNEPGINYFVGLGLGFLQGRIRAAPFVNKAPEFIPFSQSPVGSQRVGLEVKGESWGFRYELVILNADDVTLDSNPYPGTAPTTIDFSGSLIRLSIFLQF